MPRRKIVSDNNKDYGDICHVERRVIQREDRKYDDITKVEKRVFIREDKNFDDVTHVKKREIKQREQVAIEGSAPRKFNYNKKGPEITVMMTNADGSSQMMKKDIKTQRFIHVTMQSDGQK